MRGQLVLVSRFKVLAKVCYYGNGSNMSKSDILKVPWVNEDCLIVCDRFHFIGSVLAIAIGILTIIYLVGIILARVLKQSITCGDSQNLISVF